jgi:hypothetical protein
MEAIGAMNPNDSRYDRSNVPEGSWPDGTPVSNWSYAVASFGSVDARSSGEDGEDLLADPYPDLAEAA